MKMREAEQEVLRLFPGGTVFLAYERRNYSYPNSGKGFEVVCSIWVNELHNHYQGANWQEAIAALRARLRLDQQDTCPDEEEEAEEVIA